MNVSELTAKIQQNIGKVIVGKEEPVSLLLAALFCGGHVLLDDVPGTGKTTLAKTLAKSLDCSFSRVQFTPDLLPSDLSGINYYNQKTGEFVFRKGPLFASVVLADEINRATPRTQSSLLECMEERQITIDGETRVLPAPFLVIATQNPVETAGTFPLPEAQLDRFFMRLQMGYPTKTEGVEILSRFQTASPLAEITPVASAADVLAAGRACAEVFVSGAVKEYIWGILEETRTHQRVSLGVSPRGGLALMRAAQARAAIEGCAYVTPDHVRRMAPHVLAHRLVLKGQNLFSQALRAADIIGEALDRTTAPTETGVPDPDAAGKPTP